MNCLFQFVAELLLGEYVMKRVFFGAVHRWRRRWRAHDYQQFLFRRMIDHENKNLIPFLFRLRQGGGAFSRSGAQPAGGEGGVCARSCASLLLAFFVVDVVVEFCVVLRLFSRAARNYDLSCWSSHGDTPIESCTQIWRRRWRVSVMFCD